MTSINFSFLKNHQSYILLPLIFIIKVISLKKNWIIKVAIVTSQWKSELSPCSRKPYHRNGLNLCIIPWYNYQKVSHIKTRQHFNCLSKKCLRRRKIILLVSFKFMKKIFSNKNDQIWKRNWSAGSKVFKNCKFSTVIWTNINSNWNEKGIYKIQLFMDWDLRNGCVWW